MIVLVLYLVWVNMMVWFGDVVRLVRMSKCVVLLMCSMWCIMVVIGDCFGVVFGVGEYDGVVW